MLASTGFSLIQTDFSLETFTGTIHGVINLFQEIINKVYLNQISKGGKYHIYFKICNKPEKINIPFKYKTIEIPRGLIIEKEELTEMLNTVDLMKNFMKYFLAEIGYWNYENELENYINKNYS